MISWMQKHKKYLVITIWISTIAFVGAGFVGWGAYKFGGGSDAMAKVGDTKISIKEFQNRYSRLYNYYAKMFQGNFDQAKAKEIGLDKAALNDLIKEALLINFAHDLGLIVTDEEVARKIASMPVFQTNSQFDKNLYINVLKQNRMRPKDFENEVKKEILLQKMQRALAPKLFDLEFDTTASSLFMGDKIEYKSLEAKEIQVSIDPKELKRYYEEHKSQYQTPTYYDIAILEVKPQHIQVDEKKLKEYYQAHRIRYKDESGKIEPFEKVKQRVLEDYQMKLTKKEALKKYIQLKKGKIKAQVHKKIPQNSTELPPKALTQLSTFPEGKVLKPVATENGYIIVKLLKKELPKPLSFEEAKGTVQNDYLREKRAKLLLEKAKKMAKTFHGTMIPEYISRDDIDKIKELSSQEAVKFLKTLFIQEDGEGFIELSPSKVVLYRIHDQILQNRPKIDKNKPLISDNAIKLKQNIQQSNLLKRLQTIYPIKIYKGL